MNLSLSFVLSSAITLALVINLIYGVYLCKKYSSDVDSTNYRVNKSNVQFLKYFIIIKVIFDLFYCNVI